MARASLSLAKLARASAVHVGIAFLAMGGWTLFANRTHGAAAIVPALVQGVVSGLITLGLKRLLETFSARLSGPMAYVLPPLATASAILALLIGVHRLIGTPEILATIAVPWSVSSGYAILYTVALRRSPHGRAR